MFGEEIGKPPSQGRHDAEFAAFGQIGAVGQNDLRMLRQHVLGDLSLV